MATDAAVVAATHHHHNDDFYLRYYVGHKGRFGHEFMVRININ